MKERIKTCPVCHRLPAVEHMELYEGYATHCSTKGCRCGLWCLGTTRNASMVCWVNAIKRRDYQ